MSRVITNQKVNLWEGEKVVHVMDGSQRARGEKGGAKAPSHPVELL